MFFMLYEPFYIGHAMPCYMNHYVIDEPWYICVNVIQRDLSFPSDEEHPYDVQYLDASSCSIKEDLLSQWLSVSKHSPSYAKSYM